MRKPREALGVIEPPVEDVELVDELVEAVEHGIELPVVEGLSLGHRIRFYAALERLTARQTTMPRTTPAESIATSIGDEWRPLTKCWWISSVIA